MEMKLKKNIRYPYQGFTMVELLVAMVVGLLALGAIYSTFLNQHKSYVVQEETSAMNQKLRIAMFYMQREIRMAGCDPTGNANARIITANAASINFTEDVRGNLVGSDPDGDTDDERKHYLLFESKQSCEKYRWREPDGGSEYRCPRFCLSRRFFTPQRAEP